MKLQLLPSTIENGKVTAKQHLACFVIDDTVTIDAGSLAMSTNASQKKQIRDIVLTHAHIDHIAGLPLFIDDLFSHIKKPIEVYAPVEVINTLKKNIFNWEVYPDFADLQNENGVVLKYRPFEIGDSFTTKHLKFKTVGVNHKVPAVGYIVSDDNSKFAITGDTSEMDDFWDCVNNEEDLDALLIECAFPNKLARLASMSHHMTPKKLVNELNKFEKPNCSIFAINLKPSYHEEIVGEIADLNIDRLSILEVNRVYTIG